MYASKLTRNLFAYSLLLSLFIGKQAKAQADSSRVPLMIDTSLFASRASLIALPDSFSNVPTVVSWPYFYSESDALLNHDPSEADKRLYKKYKILAAADPTKKNHERYYALACAMWELEKTEEAKQMFLKILHSTEPYYSATYYHASDLGRGKRPGRYGYGSYTSHYKHYASAYLARIHAEHKEFDQALAHVAAADTVYTLEYTCGTGYMMHHTYMQSLYVMCYEGQGNYNKVIDLLLTDSYNSTPALLRSLKKLYQPQAIRDSLAAALNSLVFVADSVPTTYSTYENYGKENEVKTEISFMSGTAGMCLFGHPVTLRASYLGQGEIATREFFVKNFLESGFYRALSKEE